MSENTFLRANSDAKRSKDDHSAFWVFHSRLQEDGMRFYEIEGRMNSSGNKLELVIGFYQERMAIIDAKFSDYVSTNDILDGLVSKYGKANDYTSSVLNDPIFGGSTEIKHFYWENFANMIIDYYTTQTSNPHIIFADKLVQKKLVMKKKQKNSKLVE
jgi:hypothetical protein